MAINKSKIIYIKKRYPGQPFVIAGVLIVHKGKIFLIKEGGKWNQPAGWVELRENIIEAAKREAIEETGMGVKIDYLLGVYPLIKQKGDIILHAIKFIFVAEITGEKQKVKEKITGDWFTPKQIKALKGKFWDPDVIKEVEDYGKGKKYPLSLLKTNTNLV